MIVSVLFSLVRVLSVSVTFRKITILYAEHSVFPVFYFVRFYSVLSHFLTSADLGFNFFFFSSSKGSAALSEVIPCV